jgi:hypothetical protein
MAFLNLKPLNVHRTIDGDYNIISCEFTAHEGSH